MVADDTGEMVSEVRYSAFGEIRYDSGTMTTDYLYTGQRQEAEIGLYYYVARWYDPAIGRFIQADSIVPDPGSALGYDRYGYAFNNPMRYVDPSGHEPLLDGEINGEYRNNTAAILARYHIYTTGVHGTDRDVIAQAATIAGNAFSSILGLSPHTAFSQTHGEVNIDVTGESMDKGNCETIGGTITCTNAPDLSNTIHEFGHVFESYQISIGNNKASDLDIIRTADGESIDEKDGIWYRTTLGFKCSDSRCLSHPPSMDSSQIDGYAKIEQFADLYMNWVLDVTMDPYHGFTNDKYGDARRNYIQNQQIPWILKIGVYANE